MTEKFQARIETRHAEKMRQIVRATGLSQSQILRRLVEMAEVQPAVFTLNPSRNAKSDEIRQDSTVALCA